MKVANYVINCDKNILDFWNKQLIERFFSAPHATRLGVCFYAADRLGGGTSIRSIV